MTRLLLSLFAAALLLPASALAEDPPPAAEDEQQEASPEQREKLLKRIRLVRMYALTEALDLDEAIAAKLFPFLKGHDNKLKELHVAKRTHSKALRKMVRAGDFPQRAADEHIEELGRIEIAMAELHAAMADGLKKILSTEQRVKYVMVREKLEHEIRRTIREHRRQRMGDGAGGRGRMGGEGRRHRRGR